MINKHNKDIDTILINKQYGKWNAILAKSNNTKSVFYQNSAKIFPENLYDWITAIKKTVFQNIVVPVRLDIDITNYCPNECIMCFARELRKNHKTFIPLTKLIKIFEDFKNLGGKSIRLTGGGEPLSHSNIVDIIKILADLKLKITIETNGDLIDREIAEVVARYVHHFRISINSGDNFTREEVHRPLHPTFTYDNLIKKITLIRRNSIAINRAEELFIGATFVILPENYLTISKFVSHMYEIEVNWVALRKNIYREVYENNPQIIPFVESEIERLQNKFKNNPKNFIIEEQYGVSFNPQQDFDKCWVSYLRPIILANSSLHLCCLARNGIIPQADIGKLLDTANPVQDTLTNNKDLIKNFWDYVPKNCQFCIDKDNNISFSNIATLLKLNENTKFSKAKVILSDKNYILYQGQEIPEIGLDSQQYEKFKNGIIVNL